MEYQGKMEYLLYKQSGATQRSDPILCKYVSTLTEKKNQIDLDQSTII